MTIHHPLAPVDRFDKTVRLHIRLPQQRLYLLKEGQRMADYPVSTAKNGWGEQHHSGCTPRGWHYIRVKIGDQMPMNTVFVGRRPTGETYNAELAARYPQRDWILTRIVWLCGLERGFNRLGTCDTFRRYIYIHGCPDELPVGIALSHGCIRMRNADVVALFNQVAIGDRVFVDATDSG